MLYLRSGLFSVILWIGLTVYSAIILTYVVLPYRRRYRLAIVFPHFHNWLLKTVCGLTFEVHGKDHIPSGAAVILAKHQSTWETFAMATIFPPYVYVLKRELMWLPFFGWAVALLRPIAIDRGAGRAAVEQVVTQGRERLKSGLSVFLFPEGTRMPAGTRGRYRIGGAVLAAETGYPVVPVAHNAGTYWPRRSFIKRPGTIRVEIGPPIATAGKTAEQIIAETERWIEGTMQRLETAN
jgi:1-acyl-sn-glycerol-3-phosphate acyltransferase